MRKWMRERLQRRKKPPEKAGAESTPAPLQPAFYDNQSAPEPPAAHLESSREAEAQPEAKAEPAQDAGSVEPGNAASGASSPTRRRRSRGGRGRRRNTRPAPRLASAEQPATAQPVQTEAAATPQDQPAIPAAPPPAPRAPKGTVVLAIGLPGSGKSAWFKRHNITPLSSDLLRAILFDDPTEQRFQDLIFSNLRSMLKARLIARRPMNYVDATNLTPHDRRGWIKLAKDFGYEVQAVFFDVPVEVCMERNRKRERVVPDDVMRRMAGKLKPPTFDEGFAKITAVRVKKKDSPEAQPDE
jgi:predicted kinase